MIINTAERLAKTKEYYFSLKLQEVRKLQSEHGDVINVGIGSPDLPPAPEVIEELSQIAADGTSHGYQPYQGIPQLSEALSRYYNDIYKVELVAKDNILPLIGSKEGITHISLAFLDPGDKVLIPELGYPTYKAVTEMIGAQTLTYPLDEEKGWEPDWEGLYGLDTTGVKILWLNYPHMPTGCPPSVEIFQKFVDFARERKILLCHDNPYSRVLNQSRPLSLLSIPGAWEVAIELNSLSKSHNMAGWRVGFALGRKDYLQQVMKIKTNVDSGTFLAIQRAAARALQLPASWHEERNEVYSRRRVIAEKIVSALGCTFDPEQTGMFLWARISNDQSGSETMIDDILYGIHVFITPGVIFGPKGDRYIRISLCTAEEKLEEVLERIKRR